MFACLGDEKKNTQSREGNLTRDRAISLRTFRISNAFTIHSSACFTSDMDGNLAGFPSTIQRDDVKTSDYLK